MEPDPPPNSGAEGPMRSMAPATALLTTDPPPSLRHRLEYFVVASIAALVRPLPMRGARPGDAARRAPSSWSIGPPPARRQISRRRFPCAAAASVGRSRAKCSRTSDGCSSCCSSSARCGRSGCWRTSASKGRNGSSTPTRKGAGCPLHRTLRVLGNQRARARAGDPADGVLARPLDNPMLHRLLESVRMSTGNSVIYRRGAIRRVLRALGDNQAVAILIDQHIQSADAVYVDFFDRPAATTAALAALALHWRAGGPGIRAAPRRGPLPMQYTSTQSTRRGATSRTRCASSHSAAPTCSRCTCAGIPSCGCGCIEGGATSRVLPSRQRGCFHRRAGKRGSKCRVALFSSRVRADGFR